MRSLLTFYTSCTVGCVLLLALSVPQRLLVVAGGILGAAICNFHYKATKKVSRGGYSINFDHHRLVSVHDNGIKCIFPKKGKCGRTIKGCYLDQFDEDREHAKGYEHDTLRTHLQYMVGLKLCENCLKHDEIDKCTNSYIDKWFDELKRKLSTQSTHALENHEYITTPNESNVKDAFGLNEPPIQQTETDKNPPGSYPDSIPSDQLRHAAPHGRRSSNEPRNLSHAETQRASIDLNAAVPNNPQSPSPDPLFLNAQQTPSRPRRSPRQDSPLLSAKLMPTTPTTSADNWCLVKYTVKNPEMVHERIFKPLQIKEIESGFIYVLRRNDDEEYYKVGFTGVDVQTRLANHNKDCKGNWELVCSTDERIKHAKRVEKLIHLECEARGTRYQEKYCKTGGSNCKSHHNEIVKATLQEVKRCVEHWVDWMIRWGEYEESPRVLSAASRRRGSNRLEPAHEWKLATSHAAKRYIDKHEFYLMSNGQPWWKDPKQQKDRRRKSTSALLTPERPTVLQETRQTLSDRPPTRTTLTSDMLHVQEVSTSSPKSSISMRSNRNNAFGRSQATSSPRSTSENDEPNTKGVDMEENLQISHGLPEIVMGAGSKANAENPDPVPSAGLVKSHAVTIDGRQKCDACSKQSRNSNSPCTACVTPPPDDELSR